jgi:hypothetical protein
MADLNDAGRERAKAASGYVLAPTAADAAAASLATSQRFGPFTPGDAIIASASAGFHLVAGGASVAATTGSPPFSAGPHRLVMPAGCTHVAMIQGASAASGCAWKG